MTKKNCYSCRYKTIETIEDYRYVKSLDCNDNDWNGFSYTDENEPCIIKDVVRNTILHSTFYCNRYKRKVKNDTNKKI